MEYNPGLEYSTYDKPKKVEYHIKELEVINDDIVRCGYSDEAISEVYTYLKEMVAPKYWNYGQMKMDSNYIHILDYVYYLESKFRTKLLVDPLVFSSLQSDNSNDLVRGHISIMIRDIKRYLESNASVYSDYTLINCCKDAAMLFCELGMFHGYEVYSVPIWPGYLKEASLYGGTNFHWFNILKKNDRSFLVDITYLQFFTADQNNLERIGVVGLSGCDVGTFMMMDPERKKVAETILANGFIELKGDVLRHYLDGFTISYRNAFYYREQFKMDGKVSFPGYSNEMYYKFLRGVSNQVEIEKRYKLGTDLILTPEVFSLTKLMKR